jgi:hypothetical protein
MRTRIARISTVVLALLLLVATAAAAEYDKGTVQQTMRNNLANLPKLNAAANSGNYMEAAGYLLSMAQGMYAIREYQPPKGEKAAWDATFKAFLKAAFNGLAACGNENQEALKAAVAELTKARDSGHSQFR